jgi:cytochrome c2
MWRLRPEAMHSDTRPGLLLLGAAAGVALAGFLLTMMPSCGRSKALATGGTFGGNVQRGAMLISQVGCGACHSITGVPGANGRVGPPLDNIGDRVILAGMLPNTPRNMIIWIEKPQSIVPGNAMPDMGLNDSQARDIAAYLYTLR